MAPGGGQRTRRAGGLSGQRGGQRETAGPGADGATTANQRPAAFRESILAHANALGEPVDPGLAVTNVRYCTLIQPTLLPRRGDQFSTTAIVPTNPFTKL